MQDNLAILRAPRRARGRARGGAPRRRRPGCGASGRAGRHRGGRTRDARHLASRGGVRPGQDLVPGGRRARAAPGSRSTPCGSSPTGHRASRATPWPRPRPSRGAEVVLVTTTASPRPARRDRGAGGDRRRDGGGRVRATPPTPTWWSWPRPWPTSGPRPSAEAKLPKSDGIPELVLEPTPDILAELGRRRAARPGPGGLCGRDPRRRGPGPRPRCGAKGVDLMVANDVSAEGGVRPRHQRRDHPRADGTRRDVALSSKREVADAVLDSVVDRLGGRRARRWRRRRLWGGPRVEERHRDHVATPSHRSR